MFKAHLNPPLKRRTSNEIWLKIIFHLKALRKNIYPFSAEAKADQAVFKNEMRFF